MAEDHDRDDLVRRWLHLTRTLLPGRAEAEGWPIRLDHCFMRVFLDHAVGQPWHLVVRRPAIRHMDLALLRQAVEAAERVLREPDLLPVLNADSLRARRAQRDGRPAGMRGAV